MPDAVLIPGNIFYLKAPSGGVNPVTIQGLGGQQIDGVLTFVLNTNQGSIILRSNGAGWSSFGQGGGAGAALAIEDEGVPIDPNVILINFTGGGVVASSAGPGAVDVTIPGAGLLSGPVVPEGAIVGTPGDPYIRTAGTISSFWQFEGAAPGVVGWRAVGPRLTGAPVGVINGVNTTFTFPGGSEAVHQTAAPVGTQIAFEFNGVEQTEGVDFVVTPGAVPGTTITSVVLTVPPVLGDVLKTTFIPA